MPPIPHIVVFSHGFGVRKDDQGLFTDIAAGLPEVRCILFDYNGVDEAQGTLTVPPLNKQAAMLNKVIEDARKSELNAVIDIIGHSQGTVVAALAKPAGIRKVLFLAPVFDMGIGRTLARYGERPGSKIDLQGISRIPLLDGVGNVVPGWVRLIPPEYWVERERLKPIDLYNDLAEQAEIMVINANQDALLGTPDLFSLSPKIRVASLDGDHNFSATRNLVIDAVRARLEIA